MITTILNWSTDMSSAPRGETVSTPRTFLKAGKAIERVETEYVSVPIMALSKCGKVMRSYWVPTKGAERWSGFNVGEIPLAWTIWPDAAELVEAIKMEEPA